MKRTNQSDSNTADDKKRKVKHETYIKWKRDADRECQTASWLDCETEVGGGGKFVTKLKCKICKNYESKIVSRRNYSDKWINGADSIRITNIRDHSRSDQHVHAFNLHKKHIAQSSGSSATSYAPIAQALNILPQDEQTKLRLKFDIAYFVATEQLSFQKYSKICDLESKHGVNLGFSYQNETACKNFVHYMAEAQRHDLSSTIAKAKYFSLLMDGSTDAGNVDNELILVMWCDTDDESEKISSKLSFLCVHNPDTVNAIGLFQSLQYGLQCLGIQALDDVSCPRLVGLATDGAAVNIASGGLKGLLEREHPWIFWMWCLAHRLELAVKDALKGTVFNEIDEMLLRLYYIYEKSPKKCRELESVISDLKECFEFDDNGIKPVRASGSRWVSHKLNAMRRVLSKYGAYTAHLTQLSEEKSVKSTDRAKLKGYLKKWTDAKYLIGCSVFIDVLTPCSIFSKCMQNDSLDIIGALSCLLRTVSETNKLKDKPLAEWPTYKTTMSKISEEGDDHSPVYQCQRLLRFSEAKGLYERHHAEYCAAVTKCIRSRLERSDLKLIRDIVVFLATQGWQKIIDSNQKCSQTTDEGNPGEDENALIAVNRLVTHFHVPLEHANIDTGKIREEFEEMISYAAQFISLSTMDYQSVWWRLFHAPTSSEWSNALDLARLLFSLPASNGKLERIFSQMKIIKTNKRTSLSNESLDDLLALNSCKRPVQNFSSDSAIKLWWEAKQRRPDQSERKQYQQRGASEQATTSASRAESGDDEQEETLSLEHWDDWIGL